MKKFRVKKIPAKHKFFQRFFGTNTPKARNFPKPDRYVNYQPTRTSSEKERARKLGK